MHEVRVEADEQAGSIRVFPIIGKPLLTLRLLRAAIQAVEGLADEPAKSQLVLPNGPLPLPQPRHS